MISETINKKFFTLRAIGKQNEKNRGKSGKKRCQVLLKNHKIKLASICGFLFFCTKKGCKKELLTKSTEKSCGEDGKFKRKGKKEMKRKNVILT